MCVRACVIWKISLEIDRSAGAFVCIRVNEFPFLFTLNRLAFSLPHASCILELHSIKNRNVVHSIEIILINFSLINRFIR